jgi:hypothetical protein
MADGSWSQLLLTCAALCSAGESWMCSVQLVRPQDANNRGNDSRSQTLLLAET